MSRTCNYYDCGVTFDGIAGEPRYKCLICNYHFCGDHIKKTSVFNLNYCYDCKYEFYFQFHTLALTLHKEI